MHLLVIPGNLISHLTAVSIDLNNDNTVKEHCKYAKYQVKWSDLYQTLCNIYNDVLNKNMLELNSISLRQISHLNIPLHKTGIIELFWNKYREVNLPYLSLIKAERSYCTYDHTFNGLKIQNKKASREDRGKGWHVSFTKGNGNYNKNKPTKQIYEIGDFDIIWIFIDFSRYYVIPSTELVKLGYFKSNECKGLRNLRLYPDGTQGKGLWTNPYLMTYDDSDYNKIMKILTLPI